MKLIKPFMDIADGPIGGGSTPSGKGHLFGDALFNADFFQLQNTEGEEIIKYTKEGGLEIAGGGGGGGGDVVKVIYDEDTMSAEDLGVAVKVVVDAGKVPLVDWTGYAYYFQSAEAEEGYFRATFINWVYSVTGGELASLEVGVFSLEYTESDGWTLQDAYQEIRCQ